MQMQMQMQMQQQMQQQLLLTPKEQQQLHRLAADASWRPARALLHAAPLMAELQQVTLTLTLTLTLIAHR